MRIPLGAPPGARPAEEELMRSCSGSSMRRPAPTLTGAAGGGGEGEGHMHL